MSYCGGPSPVGSNAAGSNLTMQAPNNPGIGSSMQAPNNPGIGSSSASGASITDDRLLQQKINKVQNKANYFWGQLLVAEQGLNDLISERPIYEANNNVQE